MNEPKCWHDWLYFQEKCVYCLHRAGIDFEQVECFLLHGLWGE